MTNGLLPKPNETLDKSQKMVYICVQMNRKILLRILINEKVFYFIKKDFFLFQYPIFIESKVIDTLIIII